MRKKKLTFPLVTGERGTCRPGDTCIVCGRSPTETGEWLTINAGTYSNLSPSPDDRSKFEAFLSLMWHGPWEFWLPDLGGRMHDNAVAGLTIADDVPGGQTEILLCGLDCLKHLFASVVARLEEEMEQARAELRELERTGRPYTGRFVDRLSDGTELYCELFNEADARARDEGRPPPGPPILFVHGFPLDGRMWTDAAAELMKQRRCIVPDLRGHGQSGVSWEVTIARFADDLCELLDGLKDTRPVIICGLSMGGIIALEFFRRHRSRVAAMILCSTRAGAETPEGARRRDDFARFVMLEGSTFAAQAMLPDLLSSKADASLRERCAAMISEAPPEGIAAASRALAGRADSFPTMPLIDVPTLVICGADDVITPPQEMQEMQRRIPGSRFAMIPGAGHVPPMENVEAFVEAVQGFLREV